MNSKNISKFTLFANSLKNIYRDEINFFINLKVNLKKKNKNIIGNFTDKFVLDKKEYDYSFDESIDFIIKDLINIDEITLTYEDRRKNIVIIANEKDVSFKQYENESFGTDNIERNDYIKRPQANNLLKEIGIMTQDGKIKSDKIRKYNQIDHFIEVIDSMLKNLGNHTINILDCACGKSYLSFVLNFYIVEILRKKCNIIGVDYNNDVIEASKLRSDRLGYKNMEFICADLIEYKPEKSIDLVVSLHACDNATDFAIAKAIDLNAKNILLVPCCHKEFLSQIKNENLNSIFKHNIFKARFSDTLTDAMRSLFLESYGYDVSALEYISPLDTPKNILIRATKKTDSNKIAKSEYEKLKKFFGLNPILDKLIWREYDY